MNLSYNFGNTNENLQKKVKIKQNENETNDQMDEMYKKK